MPKKRHYCGFCGKEDDEVERMLAGPCIEICNECIDLAHKIIHEPKPILPLRPPPKPRTVIPFRRKA
jgi:ATP-dependent Clp protease ATP-binding subunit ClpX